MKKLIWTDAEGCERTMICHNQKALRRAKADMKMRGAKYKVKSCHNGHTGHRTARSRACRRLSNNRPAVVCSAA